MRKIGKIKDLPAWVTLEERFVFLLLFERKRFILMVVGLTDQGMYSHLLPLI